MQKFYSLVILLFISLSIQSQATDFVTGLNEPRDMLLDENILYVAEGNAGRIIKIDLLLPNPVPEVVISGIPMVNGLALRGTEMFFSQLNGQNRLSKFDLLDPNPTPEVILEDFITAFDLEFYGNDLYIAQFGLDRIVKIDPSIPNPPIIEVVTGVETAYDLEVVGDELYIVVWGLNKVSKIDLTDPNPVLQDVKTNLSLPVGLKIRREELYIAEAGQSIGNDRVSKIDIRIPNPPRQTIVSGLYNPTQGLEIYNDVLYIAENFKISKFELPPLSTTDFDIKNITVHPNPTSDFIELSGITEPINYSIHTISGAILRQGVVEKNEKISIEELASGNYFLILEDSKVIKVIKK